MSVYNMPKGHMQCGKDPHCKAPKKQNEGNEVKIWCVADPDCSGLNGCSCNLFKQRVFKPGDPEPPFEWEAKQGEKKDYDDGFNYECVCIRPIPTTPKGKGVKVGKSRK